MVKQMPGSAGCKICPQGGCTLTSRGGCTLTSRGGCTLTSRGGCTLTSRGGCTLTSREGRYTFTLVAALALVAFTLLVVLTGEVEPEKTHDFGPKVIDLNDASYEISFFHVKAHGEVVSGYMCEQYGWMISEPVPTPADPMQVTLLLDSFRFMNEMRAFTTDAHWSEYGLDPPDIISEVHWTGPEGTGETTIMIGDLTIDEKGHYVALQGFDNIYTVPVWSVAGADKSFEELRLKQPLMRLINADHIEGLKTRHFHCVNLYRDAETSDWFVLDGRKDWPDWEPRIESAPIKTAEADREKVDELLRSLIRLKADTVICEGPVDLEAYGFGEDDFIISISASDNRDITLLFGPLYNGKTLMYPKTNFPTLFGDMPLFGVSPRNIAQLFPGIHDMKKNSCSDRDDS